MTEKPENIEKPEQQSKQAEQATMTEDERFPGTFFRIPQPPVPGKTAWKST